MRAHTSDYIYTYHGSTYEALKQIREDGWVLCPHFGAGKDQIYEHYSINLPLVYAAPIGGISAAAHKKSITTASHYPSALHHRGKLCGERMTTDDSGPFAVTLLLRIATRSIVFSRPTSNQIGFAPRLPDPTIPMDDCEIQAVIFLPRRITHPNALEFAQEKSFLDLMWTYPTLFPWTRMDPEDSRIPYLIPNLSATTLNIESSEVILSIWTGDLRSSTGRAL